MTKVVEMGSQTFWAECRDCEFNWAAAYFPMNLTALAKVLQGHAICPQCGGPGIVPKQKNDRLTAAAPERE